jgi:hypothetical protein
MITTQAVRIQNTERSTGGSRRPRRLQARKGPFMDTAFAEDVERHLERMNSAG